MEHYSHVDKSLLHILSFTMFSGSFVLFEPAPYEILMLFIIIYALFLQLYEFNHTHFISMIMITCFILLNLISMLFSHNIQDGIPFFLISLYLIISWMGLSGIFMHYKYRALPYIFKGYTLGAVITVLIGIIAFQYEIFTEILLKYGRVQGFFKDPNVFGPYLIPANLYTLWVFTQFGFKKLCGWIYFFSFLILSMGILLSFSRAAWGQYLLALLFYLIFMRSGMWKRMKLLTVLMVMGIPLLIYIVMATDSYTMLIERTGMQSYDDNRFSNQASALHGMFQNFLGVGPGQAESELAFSTHSLFIRILFENGILGLLTFIGFYFICLGRSIYFQFTTNHVIQGYFVIISASLLGILFNSFFVDTLHWRHMWLLLAIPFMKRS